MRRGVKLFVAIYALFFMLYYSLFCGLDFYFLVIEYSVFIYISSVIYSF